MSLYCGIDLGARRSHIAVVDQDGRVLLNRRVPNDTRHILDVLAPFADDLRIVVESTFNWYWLVDALIDSGFDVTLAHTFALKAITTAKVKTDKRDALALARVHRLDSVPVAFIYPRQQRTARDLLRRRLQLVRRRGDEYGALRRLLLRHGKLDHSRAGITKITKGHLAELFEPAVLPAAEQHLERAELFSSQIADLERLVAEYTDSHLSEDLRLLETLYGVSTVLGQTILYETGPISRFKSARRYSSYARVVPGTYQSGSVSRRRGHQSKQGNPHLKWAFNQAAVHAVRNYVVARQCFDRHVAGHRGKPGKLIAYNTIAHKLAVATYRILHDRVPFNPTLQFGTPVAETGRDPELLSGMSPNQ